MKNLVTIINYIVKQSAKLKNKFTNASLAPVEFGCVFCQSKKEYKEFTNSIEKFGKIVERTQSGFTYLLDKPIITIAGPLRLVKIRKPDANHLERGDADFNTDYKTFKEKHQSDSRFELVKRETYEYLRLSDSDFDVMACFSNIPKSKDLGISL